MYALNAHDEISAYVAKHVLYKEALELYKYQTEYQREITKLYADYLQDQSKYKDAAIGKWFGCNKARQNGQRAKLSQPQRSSLLSFMRVLTDALTWHTNGASHCTVP